MMESPSPSTPQQQRQQQRPSCCALLTGAGAGLLLLVLVGLVLWAGPPPDSGLLDATGPAAGGGGLRLFRRGDGGGGREQNGLESAQRQGQGLRAPSLRRPGRALGPTDVLWGLEPRCLAGLYFGSAAGGGACGCNANITTTAAAQTTTRLVFVDADNDGRPWLAGSTVRFTLRSRHACSDVLNAAFHSPGDLNVLGRDLTVPARVLALDGGVYAVASTLHHAGTYTLKAWILWEGFAPRVECRASPCRRCHEDAAPRYTHGAAARAVRVMDDESPSPATVTSPLPICASLDAMLDGAWIQDPTLLPEYHDRVREEMEEAAPPPAQPPSNASSSNDTPGLYTRLAGAWVPYTCRLPLHAPATLQRVLKGKHLHFIGDSTTREFMHGVMRLLWPERPALAHDHAWVPNDYDSGGEFPTRFSFNWVGGAATSDSMKGLAALVQRPQRFLRALRRDADFVFISAGTHDVAGKRSIPDYAAALSTVFDWVAARVDSVKRDPRRAVWRPALPLLSQFYKPDVGFVNGSCRQEHSAALQWMRYLGAKEARTRGFGVLDAYRIVEAEDVGRAWAEGRRLPCSVDGMHYEGCDSYTAVLAVYLHHVIWMVEEEEEGVGKGRKMSEVECGLDGSCS